MANEIEKKDNGSTLTTDPLKPRRFAAQTSALHKRVASAANAAKEEDTNTASMPNRIALMLDDSGSMAGTEIVLAKQAAQGFLDACNSNDTSVAIHTLHNTVSIAMTRQFTFATMECENLRATGGTPLAELMDNTLMNESMTRGIIVSDGEPDEVEACFKQAYNYKEAGTPIDCVHIGNSASGEETLARIASITSGLYIKFDNVENFSKNFKFLTPRYRAMLADRASAARILGAKEVK